MSKQDQIRDLFKDFGRGDFFKFNECRPDFSCEHDNKHDNKCGVNQDADPIWAPAYGSDNSKVMIIALAPSKGKEDKWWPHRGPGPHVPGLFGEAAIDKAADKGLSTLRKLLIDETGDVPYFTDLIKCGPADAGDTKTIKNRVNHCIKKYLLKEIEIIKPTLICCIGTMSYTELVRIGTDCISKHTGKKITLKNMVHYSRQANLYIDTNDKKIIWRWQLGDLAANKVSNTDPLSSLSFFKEGSTK